MFLDPLFIVMVAPAIVISLWAQAKISSTFAKYSRVTSRGGHTGASAARAILAAAGVPVDVEPVGGRLTDHYDPRSRRLRLSEGVYGSRSVAALGVAAHEAGHAIQHARMYGPMAVRNLFAPAASLGSRAWIVLFILGIVLGMASPLGGALMKIAVIAFAAVVAFQIITLPVEIDASRRALALLTKHGIVEADELKGAKKVLTAAALTYVAAALYGVLQLLYLLARSRR